MMCFTACLAGCNSAAPDIEQQVNELYQKMPQEERIAQLKSMYMDELFNEQGQLDTAKCRELNLTASDTSHSSACSSPEIPMNCAIAPLPSRTG